jgi:hypothetical protein
LSNILKYKYSSTKKYILRIETINKRLRSWLIPQDRNYINTSIGRH